MFSIASNDIYCFPGVVPSIFKMKDVQPASSFRTKQVGDRPPALDIDWATESELLQLNFDVVIHRARTISYSIGSGMR